MKKIVFEGRQNEFAGTDLKRLAEGIGAVQLARYDGENQSDVYYSDKHNVVLVYDSSNGPYYHRVVLYGGLDKQIEEVEREVLKAKSEIKFNSDGGRLTPY